MGSTRVVAKDCVGQVMGAAGQIFLELASSLLVQPVVQKWESHRDLETAMILRTRKNWS